MHSPVETDHPCKCKMNGLLYYYFLDFYFLENLESTNDGDFCGFKTLSL